jgi:hypothetical protein
MNAQEKLNISVRPVRAEDHAYALDARTMARVRA